jgi:hypothetical protein
MPSHLPKSARACGGARPRHHILRVNCGMPLPLCISIFAVMHGGFGAGGGRVQAFSALGMPCWGNRVLLTSGIPARTLGWAGPIGSGRRGQGCARLSMEAKKEEEQDSKFVEETKRAKGTGGGTDGGRKGKWVHRWTRCEHFTSCVTFPVDTFLMRVLAVARVSRSACACVSVFARTYPHVYMHAAKMMCATSPAHRFTSDLET